MLTYKYKLYRTKRARHLADMKREACFVWNHALELQKRYYTMYGKYVSGNTMKKHFSKRIRRTYLHSQSVQEVIERLDTAYKRFFQHKAKRPPKPKSHKDFRSFAFKQGGFALMGNTFHLNSVKKDFRFSFSRPFKGNVKQVRLKLSPNGDWYLYVITDAHPEACGKSHNGASVGIDFGLKTYMTFSTGEKLQHPQFLKADLKHLARFARAYSRTAKGSKRREYARRSLASFHEHLADKRRDYQWKLAHELCRKYDYIFLEDLSLKGMTRLWGRKMSDLAHAQFVEILEQVAVKYGCTVHKIDRWFASSKLCDCGFENEALTLRDRSWICPVCGRSHDRDIHAAQNILRRGIYELTSGSETIETSVEGHPAQAS